ncbi:MAG TPA: hypothetical protein VFU16_01210 [Solirubrobacterales bacterium]|nr:hypothetical protein [Solirubrobacterales bacterium]
MEMGWTDTLQVFCADIGSIANDGFAWARRISGSEVEELHRPESIESLAGSVVDVLRKGEPVALGFEAPLFLPVPESPARLGKARPCDAPSPSWSSSVGASVLATAMAQIPWTLKFIHEQVPGAQAHVQWPPFAEQQGGLLLWEAFVSGAAKGATHEQDARNGVQAFCDQLPNPGDSSAAETERPFSLLAAAAIWAGFDLATEAMQDDCLLVRAT